MDFNIIIFYDVIYSIKNNINNVIVMVKCIFYYISVVKSTDFCTSRY